MQDSSQQRHQKLASTRRRERANNLVITLLLLSSLFSVVRSIVVPHFVHPPTGFSVGAFRQIVFTQRVVENLAALIIILLCIGLYRRLRPHWFIAIVLVPVLGIGNMARSHWIVGALQIIAWIGLLGFRRSFHRDPDPLTWKKGLVAAGVSFAVIVANVAYCIYLHNRASTPGSVVASIQDAFAYLFTMDFTVMDAHGRFVDFYLQAALIVNWAALLAAAFFIIKPLVIDPWSSAKKRSHAADLLRTYGVNPVSYVALEPDKSYFFATEVEGFIAYTTIGNVVMCAGDPVCDPADLPLLLSEFILKCRENNEGILFCQTMPELRETYRSLGFGSIKYGEEAMFDLQTYTTSGNKRMKMRNCVSRAKKEGVQVYEYAPLEQRDHKLEQALMNVSRQWENVKGSGNGASHSFMISSVGLHDPREKRYFYAIDESDGEASFDEKGSLRPGRPVVAFTVFVPYVATQNGEARKGYMADVTRRAPDAPYGVMQALTIAAWEQFKEEGVASASLGLSPLLNIPDEHDKNELVPRVLHYVYENLNSVYGFKALYSYKKKYGPTSWEPRYLTFYPKRFTPQMAYALIKSQNPEGVSRMLLTQLSSLGKRGK